MRLKIILLLPPLMLGLFVSSLVKRLVPFSRIERLLGHPINTRAYYSLLPTGSSKDWARAIKRSLPYAVRYTPLTVNCLDKVLAIACLFRMVGIPYSAYVGCGRVNGVFSAHAWLHSGSLCVVGGWSFDTFEILGGYVQRRL